MAAALIVAAVAFAAIFCLVYGLAPRRPNVDIIEARLAHLGESGRPLSLAEAELSLPLAERVLRPLIERVGRALASRTPAKQQEMLQDRLNLAGRPMGLTVGSFLVLRVMLLFGLAIVGYGVAQLLGLQSPLNLLLPVGLGALGYLLPTGMVSRRVRARQKAILLAMPSSLDLLTISVEAGLGFDAAMARVADKYNNALSAEFHQVLNEVRLGRPRLEALEDMGKRTRVDELNTFVQAVIQSEQLGVGIANVLRIQSEEMRRRRRQRAEEQGQKAPLKMLFPMVLCIFPALFIVLLGPAAVILAKQFST